MGHFSAICDVLRIKGIEPLDALRLLMLYALRYERARPDKVRRMPGTVSHDLPACNPSVFVLQVSELRRIVRDVAGDKVCASTLLRNRRRLAH